MTEPLAGEHPVGCKWVFTLEYTSMVALVATRLHLLVVAKGFMQIY